MPNLLTGFIEFQRTLNEGEQERIIKDLEERGCIVHDSYWSESDGLHRVVIETPGTSLIANAPKLFNDTDTDLVVIDAYLSTG